MGNPILEGHKRVVCVTLGSRKVSNPRHRIPKNGGDIGVVLEGKVYEVDSRKNNNNFVRFVKDRSFGNINTKRHGEEDLVIYREGTGNIDFM